MTHDWISPSKNISKKILINEQ